MARRSDDDDETIRDGETIRVPLLVMDGMQRQVSAQTFDAATHRPGFRGITADTAAADASREAMLAHLRDAWRSKPIAQPAPIAQPSLPRDAAAPLADAAARDAALAAHNAWLKDAWRSV